MCNWMVLQKVTINEFNTKRSNFIGMKNEDTCRTGEKKLKISMIYEETRKRGPWELQDGDTFRRNVGNHLLSDVASRPLRPESSITLLWQTKPSRMTMTMQLATVDKPVFDDRKLRNPALRHRGPPTKRWKDWPHLKEKRNRNTSPVVHSQCTVRSEYF